MNKPNSELHVIVYNVKRGPLSPMGNPSFIFRTDHGPYRTKSNLGAAYGLENDFTVGTELDIPATLTLSYSGWVIGWKV